MSQSYLRKNIKLLEFLTKCKDRSLIENILHSVKPEFMILLRNIVRNIIENASIFDNISKKSKLKLSYHKKLVYKILKTKNCTTLKKLFLHETKQDSSLHKQKGGFIGTFFSILSSVIPMILPAILSLSKKKRK